MYDAFRGRDPPLRMMVATIAARARLDPRNAAKERRRDVMEEDLLTISSLPAPRAQNDIKRGKGVGTNAREGRKGAQLGPYPRKGGDEKGR